jgi:hypothetical protein
LYRDIDIDVDASAQRSPALADALVVLNERGAYRLSADCRSTCRVVLQSSPSRLILPKTDKRLRALMVGHLRDERILEPTSAPRNVWPIAQTSG